MIAFADTSLLCAIYREQEDSVEADGLMSGRNTPLAISSLVAFEFRQSVRLQIFRFSSDRRQGFSGEEASKMLAKFDANLAAGALEILPVTWPDVYSLGERLSARSTATGGHRSLDLLHVATALHCRASEFLTFDENQACLARANGLSVRPCAGRR